MMKRTLFFLLLVFSSSVFANTDDLSAEVLTSTIQVNQLFDEQNSNDIKSLTDLIDKGEKISSCVEIYIKKQSKSYSKIVQNNLYDLINNFSRITAKLSGKKQVMDEVMYEDKIEALARVQCDAYYAMGALK